MRSSFHVIYPDLTNPRDRDSHERHRLPFHLAWLGLLLYLLISDSLLVTLGIPYNIPSGSFLSKLHPGTYLISLGYVILLFQGHPRELWIRLYSTAAVPLLFGGIVLGVLAYTGIRFGPSGNAFYIDSLLMPALLGAVLLQAPLKSQRSVFRMVLAVLVANALLGIGEAFSGWRMTPYLVSGQPQTEEFFRATALGGHPLKNSLRTATVLIASLMLPFRLRLFLIPVLLIALLAFGSRTALAMSLLLLGGWSFYVYSREIVLRTLDPRLVFGLILIMLLMGVGVVLVVMGTGLGTRIIASFYWDTSAEHRILIFKVFDYFSLQDWLWGMGPPGSAWVLDRLKASTSMGGFENFWVELIMEIGLAWCIPLFLTLLWMIASLVRQAPPALKLAAVMFLILASSNNSLATKSQELAILVAILVGGSAEATLMAQSTSLALRRRSTLMPSLQRVQSHPDPDGGDRCPANQLIL